MKIHAFITKSFLRVLPGLVLAIAVSSTLEASTGTISGTIRDAETGDVLANVTVQIPDLGIGDISDEEGTFRIERVPAGACSVQASMVGYLPFREEITVGEDGEVVLEVDLFPEPIPMEPIEVRALKPIRERVLDVVRAAEAYYLKFGSPKEISGEESGILAGAAKAIAGGLYEEARNHAEAIGYTVNLYTDPDTEREYVVLEEEGEPVHGWGTFIYTPGYRFVNIIVHKIALDFSGPNMLEIASSTFEELGARAFLICSGRTSRSGGGGRRTPFKCVLDAWSDEGTLLVQIAGPEATRGSRRRVDVSNVRIVDNGQGETPGYGYVYPEIVREVQYAFRDMGFGMRGRGSKSRRVGIGRGHAGSYERRKGEDEVSYVSNIKTSIYDVEIPSFGVIVSGRALSRSGEGVLDARLVKDALVKFLIKKVLDGLTPEERSEAYSLFSRSRPSKLDIYQIGNYIRQLEDPYLYARQRIIEDLVYAGPMAVQPLVDALVNFDNQHIREGVTEALAGIGGPAMDPLIGLLEVPDPYVRARSAWALRQIGDSRAGLPLIELLEDPDPKVRREAIMGVGELRVSQAVPSLIELLELGSIETRRDAVSALGAIRDRRAISALEALLTDRDSLVRKLAVQAMGEIVSESPEDIGPLLSALRSGDPIVRMEAASALQTLRSQEAVGTLLELLNDASRGVRTAAVRALGAMGDVRAESALMEKLDDPDWQVRQRAALSLGELRATGSVLQVTERLRDDDPYVRMSATRALGEIGDTRAVGPLIEALDDVDQNVRVEAIFSLEKLHDRRGTEPLVALLTDTDPKIRNGAADALRKILEENPQDVDIMDRLLASADPALRREALEALHALSRPGTSDPLLAMLEDKDAKVREKVSEILGRTGSRDAVTPLIERLYDKNLHVRVEIIRSLGKLKDAQAVASLLDIQDRTVRYFGQMTPEEKLLQRESTRALRKILSANPEDTETLARAMRARDSEVRQDVIVLLGRRYESDATQALIDALDDLDTYVRRHAALALGRRQAAGAASTLMTCLKDRESSVRSASAWALGELRCAESLDALTELLEDEDWHVRKEAATSLGKLGNPSVATSLEKMMEGERREVRIAAEWALNALSPHPEEP